MDKTVKQERLGGGRILEVELGDVVDYGVALEAQNRRAALRRQDAVADLLLLLEHPPVYTMGRRESWQDLLCEQQQLPAPLFKVSRGGEVTYHGPGQLVGYLLARLSGFPFGLRELVFRLEQLFIDFLWQQWRLTAGRDPQHRGVWFEGQKIVAIGLAVHGGVTMHGFAFNLWPDLSFYRHIIACGIKDRGVVSLAKILPDQASLPGMDVIKKMVGEKLAQLLGYDRFVYTDGELPTGGDYGQRAAAGT